ncbi:hypothetical protein [Flavobacterium koreense]
MKRYYFAAIFISLSVVIIFLFDYFFGQDFVKENTYRFIVVWLVIAFYAGQFSTRFPKE